MLPWRSAGELDCDGVPACWPRASTRQARVGARPAHVTGGLLWNASPHAPGAPRRPLASARRGRSVLSLVAGAAREATRAGRRVLQGRRRALLESAHERRCAGRAQSGLSASARGRPGARGGGRGAAVCLYRHPCRAGGGLAAEVRRTQRRSVQAHAACFRNLSPCCCWAA